ncbi:MAG: YebC/PmpR family DNA-binding transcriptional regulator [Lentisphaerae bacterium]|jgi:YebC/PmpR family DNA-binding regulatory protein|nr:YebC/PmpR family DNA-binding transcriptional regulator [Lentisphaerota bacterium]MBT4816202.1 YebC/PmpR family DNA-binding transcriptional regulator [Lentisphaerota bacterium]MBT5609559.1 YebC/PmpR family DNA-binding transcriptional regulator [Lentisphaerota bacterium]MBT7058465.1 YebC/PmpR family DNA-binding transcriptional regulator [Lentisphaerota bacterium]MBT7843174.1 YebC/PmpR family DNA-binding transcriptional regulator [Lentisphaerota bacterium]
MSGHNKWSSIKHKKGAADAKRGKMFSRLGKEITMAARDGGGDIDMNPRLRSAVTAAKAVNMPADNIERAVKKGTGELEGGVIEELSYEGYAAGGVAIIVNCLSDNRNRTAAEIRNIFTKNNSSLAGNGAVAWMFHRKARFLVTGEAADEERLLEVLMDADADVEDIDVSDEGAEILGPPEAFADILSALEAEEIPVSESSLAMVPENTLEVTEAATARQVLRMIEALEDNDDAQEVYSNFEMSETLMEQLAAE